MSRSKGAGNYDGSHLPSAFDEVRVGWNNHQSSPPGFTAWLDDFALDDERVVVCRSTDYDPEVGCSMRGPDDNLRPR